MKKSIFFTTLLILGLLMGSTIFAGTCELYYKSGWNKAFLHYNADNKGWNIQPDAELSDEGSFEGYKRVAIDANSLVFSIVVLLFVGY